MNFIKCYKNTIKKQNKILLILIYFFKLILIQAINIFIKLFLFLRHR